MSDSEHSTITYTSVSEDDLYMGSPGVEVPIYEGPPSPDYVPGPEEPEQAPPSPIYPFHLFRHQGIAGVRPEEDPSRWMTRRTSYIAYRRTAWMSIRTPGADTFLSEEDAEVY
ncbi:hypothetical protein Tco_0285768 [Tanacetum coccineum]|uniref:Uncharacterized protein n=1 Tax=Tanacetum coccineum TaxID=301880 RepID=A0ABQ5J1L1_9ASTR